MNDADNETLRAVRQRADADGRRTDRSLGDSLAHLTHEERAAIDRALWSSVDVIAEGRES